MCLRKISQPIRIIKYSFCVILLRLHHLLQKSGSPHLQNVQDINEKNPSKSFKIFKTSMNKSTLTAHIPACSVSSLLFRNTSGSAWNIFTQPATISLGPEHFHWSGNDTGGRGIRQRIWVFTWTRCDFLLFARMFNGECCDFLLFGECCQYFLKLFYLLMVQVNAPSLLVTFVHFLVW